MSRVCDVNGGGCRLCTRRVVISSPPSLREKGSSSLGQKAGFPAAPVTQSGRPLGSRGLQAKLLGSPRGAVAASRSRDSYWQFA